MVSLKELMPASWRDALAEEFEKPYIAKLEEFLEEEWREQTIFPPKDQMFTAFEKSAYDEVKVLLLGQDPYHGPGQAHGLSFSVCPGVTIPPSLRNIYKELQSDLGCEIPNTGYLLPWANQGVMLLNAVLTVRARQAGSHKKQGWEKFSDAVIKKLNAREKPLVFLLWGGFAKKKVKFIDSDRHTVIQGTHPSPLSAKNGFFDSRPFSEINKALEGFGVEPIDWQIPVQKSAKKKAVKKPSAPW